MKPERKGVGASASGETSPMLRAVRYVRGVRQELDRVVWPGRQDMVRATATVLVMTVVAALFFLVIDELISQTVQWILR